MKREINRFMNCFKIQRLCQIIKTSDGWPKKKRLLTWTGLGLLGVTGVFIIAVIVILNTILTPEKITPLLLKASKDYIRGDVACESIDVTFFSVFPDLGVRMKNGSISSGIDTLLAFEQFTVTIHPLAFLLKKQIFIQQVEVENADVYVHIDKQGQLNWAIFNPTDSIQIAGDTTAFIMPEMNISSIRLNNVHLIYDDVQQDMFVMIDSLHMRLRGNLSKERAHLSFGMQTPAITAYYQGQTFARSLPFSFRTTVVRDQADESVTIEQGTLKVGTVELTLNGVLKQNSPSDSVDVDVDFTLNASSLGDLIRMIPDGLSGEVKNLITIGKVESNGKVSGQIGNNLYPLVSLSFQLTDGSVASAKNHKKPLIANVQVDFQAFFDPSKKQPSSVKLNKLHLQTASSTLTAKGEFDHLLTKPALKTHAKANVDLTQLSNIWPMDGLTMEGLIDFDLQIQCLLDDILTFNYGKINANGMANIKDVKFNHAMEKITFYTSNADMRLGINTKDSISERFPEHLLRCRIVLDTMHLNRNDELVANSGRLSMVIATSEPKDTVSIVPITIRSRISAIRMVMGDSLRIRGVQAVGGITIRPRINMPHLPEISGNLTIDTLMGRERDLSGRISKAAFNFKLEKQPARQQNTLTERLMASDSSRITPADTTSRRPYALLTPEQRDSLRRSRSDPTTNLSFQIASQETKDMLRSWELSGGLVSDDATIRTPYFPLPIRMVAPEFSFNDNVLKLANAHFHIGESDFTLKGDVEGIRRALLYNGTVSIKMTLEADSIDFNEIIRTAALGSEYSRKEIAEKDSILKSVLDENSPVMRVDDSIPAGVFVVPRNLDVEFMSRIQNAKFSNLAIRNARGRIILRDQAVQIPRLRLNTSIGDATMTLIYKAPDPKGAYLGLDLNVKKIDLKELISALPVFVEMAPMINSFEGLVDCEMAVVSELDSLLNVQLPKTTASCLMSGQNMVLLDGETFAEISKTLMFKNKNKNIIDSMSVEMILQDEKLMIFPFQLTIDRYNVAVGGMQYLDMSFNYHITVLKSPIPFKLGLNISGTPDNMKIRPGKAKYKDLFSATREKKITNTINLRKEMDERLRQSILDIAGMELRQPMRRPRLELPDSLQQTFFQLVDTVAVSLMEVSPLETTPAEVNKNEEQQQQDVVAPH